MFFIGAFVMGKILDKFAATIGRFKAVMEEAKAQKAAALKAPPSLFLQDIYHNYKYVGASKSHLFLRLSVPDDKNGRIEIIEFNTNEGESVGFFSRQIRTTGAVKGNFDLASAELSSTVDDHDRHRLFITDKAHNNGDTNSYLDVTGYDRNQLQAALTKAKLGLSNNATPTKPSGSGHNGGMDASGKPDRLRLN
jgi:hypothetical protein